MTNYEKYKAMTKLVEDAYGSHLVDMSVDAENCDQERCEIFHNIRQGISSTFGTQKMSTD